MNFSRRQIHVRLWQFLCLPFWGSTCGVLLFALDSRWLSAGLTEHDSCTLSSSYMSKTGDLTRLWRKQPVSSSKTESNVRKKQFRVRKITHTHTLTHLSLSGVTNLCETESYFTGTASYERKILFLCIRESQLSPLTHTPLLPPKTDCRESKQSSRKTTKRAERTNGWYLDRSAALVPSQRERL